MFTFIFLTVVAVVAVAVAIVLSFISPPKDLAEITVVKGDHVGGHRVVRRLRNLTTQGHPTTLRAKGALTQMVREAGGNALLNYTWHKNREKGLFGDWKDVFWAEGEAAIIEKKGNNSGTAGSEE